MIYKVIPGDSQEELIKQCGQMIQVWEDRAHIKSAASRQFSRQDLEAHAPPAGKFLSHMITMGSSDLYGANRNSDDFPHEQLLKKHATFVTHGKNYREHRNKDPKKALGEIVAEKYDPELQRGEVLMHTDIDKAPEEFEKARKGEEQHGSMACKIDHDLCEGCGFKSKVAADRCDHIRFTPGAYLPEFNKYAHMINIDPTFVDYSWVRRPADRIAHTLDYLMPMAKAASEGRALRGDELAELYGITGSCWKPQLEKIAEFDQPHHEHPGKQAAAQVLLSRAFDGEFDQELVSKMAAHTYPGRVMRSLISRQMVMPLVTFNAFVTGKSIMASQADPVVKEASEKMASIRAILIHQLDSPEASSMFGQAVNQFSPMSDCCDDVVDQFMDKARDQFSLRYEALSKRACYNPIKLASAPPVSPASPEAFGLAALYNAYLVKTASQLGDDWMIAGQLAFLR